MDMKDVVIGVLANRNSQKVNFPYTGSNGARFMISPLNLLAVAEAIRQGRINVAPGAPAGKAVYTADANGFGGQANILYYDANNNAAGEIVNSLYVHESIHANFDLVRMTLPWLDNETIAYIAQGFYLKSAGIADGMAEPAYLGTKIATDYENGNNNSEWIGTLQDYLLNDPDYGHYINKNFVGNG